MTKILQISLLASLLLAPTACGLAPDENVGSTADGIAGGTPDPAARSVGFLVEHAPGGITVEPACTATLVGKRTVVTSAQCVAGPGSTFTDFHIGRAEAAGKSVDKLATERQSTSLLARWATPEEVAWPILWLASDEASFITGATLMVDG